MNLLNRLKIKAKLRIVLGLSALALAVAIALAASFLQQKMMADRLDKLHTVVEMALNIAQSLEDEVAAKRLTREEALARFRDRVDSMWYDGHHNYLIAATLDGVFVANGNNPKMEGTTGTRDAKGNLIISSFVDVVKNADDGTILFDYPKPGQSEPLPKLSYIRKFAPWNMLLSSGVWVDDIRSEYHALLFRFGGVGLLIFLAIGSIAFFINRDVAKSLGNLKGKMERLAAGDLEVEIGETSRHDEIGDIARTLEVFKTGAIAMRRLELKQAEMARRAEQDRKTAFNSLAGTFENRARGIVDVFSQSATQMQSTARSMSKIADDTRKQTVAVAAGATETTSNVHTVAVASEELSASIAEIGNQVPRPRASPRRPPTKRYAPTPTWRPSPTPRSGWARWWRSSTRSPRRRTCWRSTPPSRRRAPARPARASPWSPAR